MITLTGPGSITTCDGITRRDFLQVGTLGALGFNLANLAAAEATLKSTEKQGDKACILMFFQVLSPHRSIRHAGPPDKRWPLFCFL